MKLFITDFWDMFDGKVAKLTNGRHRDLSYGVWLLETNVLKDKRSANDTTNDSLTGASSINTSDTSRSRILLGIDPAVGVKGKPKKKA